MFQQVMVPVDMAHLDLIEPALQVAADQARHHGAAVCYVAVTATTPGPVAQTPEAYQRKLEAFAHERARIHGQPVSAHVITRADPIAELDAALIDAIDEIGADLVVMATHPPKHLDAVISAHGGKVASRTDASVFLVRPKRP